MSAGTSCGSPPPPTVRSHRVDRRDTVEFGRDPRSRSQEATSRAISPSPAPPRTGVQVDRIDADQLLQRATASLTAVRIST